MFTTKQYRAKAVEYGELVKTSIDANQRRDFQWLLWLSCLPQYFDPKNTGEDCELADKKKNDNRVLHNLLLYRPAGTSPN